MLMSSLCKWHQAPANSQASLVSNTFRWQSLNWLLIQVVLVGKSHPEIAKPLAFILALKSLAKHICLHYVLFGGSFSPWIRTALRKYMIWVYLTIWFVIELFYWKHFFVVFLTEKCAKMNYFMKILHENQNREAMFCVNKNLAFLVYSVFIYLFDISYRLSLVLICTDACHFV